MRRKADVISMAEHRGRLHGLEQAVVRAADRVGWYRALLVLLDEIARTGVAEHVAAQSYQKRLKQRGKKRSKG